MYIFFSFDAIILVNKDVYSVHTYVYITKRRSYSDLNFGVTFLEHSVYHKEKMQDSVLGHERDEMLAVHLAKTYRR